MSLLSGDIEESLSQAYKVVNTSTELHLLKTNYIVRALYILQVYQRSLEQDRSSSSSSTSDLIENCTFCLNKNDVKRLGELGLEACKYNGNTVAYKTIWNVLHEVDIKVPYDLTFVTKTEEFNEDKYERLLANMEQEKITRVLSNIRPAVLELAQFLQCIGRYTEGIHLLYANDFLLIYSSSDTDEAIQLLIAFSLFAAMTQHTPDSLRLLQGIPLGTTSSSHAVLVARGLLYLLENNFDRAFHTFHTLLQETPELSLLSSVICIKDIHCYTAILSMIVPDTDHTMMTIADNLGITRDMYFHFINCRFKDALVQFRQFIPRLYLDPFLGQFIKTIYTGINQQAVIQFASAFKNVYFTTISLSIGISVSDAIAYLTTAIQTQRLNGRLDLINQVITRGCSYIHSNQQIYRKRQVSSGVAALESSQLSNNELLNTLQLYILQSRSKFGESRIKALHF